MEFDKAKIDSIRHEIDLLEKEKIELQKKIEAKTSELNVAIRTFNAMQGTRLPPKVSTMGVSEKIEMARKR
jgi:hypothetical protein